MEETQKKGMFDWYFKTSLLTRILIGLVLGIVVGVILATTPSAVPGFVGNTKFFCDVFIRLLQMIVVPVIFFSLITGAASIHPSQLGRVGVKPIIFYLVLMIVAISIGLGMAAIFQPGLGLNLVGESGLPGKTSNAPPLSSIFLNIVPKNPIEALAKGSVLPIIFFAICFGIALSVVRDSKKADIAKAGDMLYMVIQGCAETMYAVVRGVMEYAPIGMFFIISGVCATQGPKVLGPLVFVIGITYVAYIIHVIVGFG